MTPNQRYLLIINQFIKRPCFQKRNFNGKQETTLFDDTIRNNIKYAKEDATDEEILKVSSFHFVMSLSISCQIN